MGLLVGRYSTQHSYRTPQLCDVCISEVCIASRKDGRQIDSLRCWIVEIDVLQCVSKLMVQVRREVYILETAAKKNTSER